MSRMRAKVQRAAAQREVDRAVARALLEAGPGERPRETPRSRLDEEYALLRGIPVVGVQGGKGGAIVGTKPDVR